MTKPTRTSADLPPHKAARLERLEDQLRANLKRRKEAARARQDAAGAGDARAAGGAPASPGGDPADA